MNIYEVKFKAHKQDEKGLLLVKGKYIITDAVTCGDAEQCVYSHVKQDGMTDVMVLGVQLKGVREIIKKNEDRLWWVKVEEYIEDVMTGKVDKIASTFLVGANSAKDASDALVSGYELADAYDIQKVSDSKVTCVVSAISRN